MIPSSPAITRTLARATSSSLAMAPARSMSAAAAAKPAQTAPPGYSIDPSVGPMLRFQRSLPHLPVPTLAETSAKYIASVEPFATSPEDFAASKKAVEEFVASEQGLELQRRLEHRASGEGRASWLSEWWNDVAYMGYRDPIVPFVNCESSSSLSLPN